MSVAILDSSTAAAVAAATTQEAQCAALAAAWGGGNVTVRVMAGSTLLSTLTQGPFVAGSTVPRRLTLGARLARTSVSAGTPTRVVFRSGSTDIFELTAGVASGEVSFAAAITSLASERIDGLVITALASLPLSPTYLLTFAADDTATVSVAAAGSIVNNGTGSCSWSITPPSGIAVSPSSGTLAAGDTQALSITATVAATYSLTLVSAGATIAGSPQSIVVSAATATMLTLSVVSSGPAGTPVTVTVTPNGPIPAGGGTATISATAGSLGSTSLSFTAGSAAAQSTTLTCPIAGVSTLTLTNSMGLSNAGSPASFTATAAVGSFASVALESTGSSVPSAVAAQTVVVELHGSGTAYSFPGLRYNADMTTGGLGYSTDTVFRFALADGGTIGGNRATMVRPWDRQGTYPDGTTRRESFWLGWTDGPDSGQMRLYTEHRLDRMIEWIKANQPNLSPTRWALTGGSMGGWGTMTYGIRRPNIFPAIWPDRPRWRSCETAGSVRLPSWAVAVTPAYTFAAAPALVGDDGGTSAAAHLDLIAYVANTSHAVPWVGWHIGRKDGYMPFQDHIDAVAALRSSGRGFAFYWNNDVHTVNNYRAAEITAGYPLGLFELGKGYPVFSEHSLDDDPAVDLVGGINVGLTFRNVVESAGAWSCEVSYPGTSSRPAQACTVKVKPHSSIYTGNPAPQLVALPAAGAWVAVSF